MQIIRSIQNRIYEVREQGVMLDIDVAALYEVNTELLTIGVRRNIRKFPADFMFIVNTHEYESLGLQIQTSNSKNVIRKIAEQDRISSLPLAFTAQGVLMLSQVLNTETAIAMHISTVRAFARLKKALLTETDWKQFIEQIKIEAGRNNDKLNQICNAIEDIINHKQLHKKRMTRCQ